jgi:hypothetical protein
MLYKMSWECLLTVRDDELDMEDIIGGCREVWETGDASSDVAGTAGRVREVTRVDLEKKTGDGAREEPVESWKVLENAGDGKSQERLWIDRRISLTLACRLAGNVVTIRCWPEAGPGAALHPARNTNTYGIH